jgi:DNA (cytosine-5)-methyltransferase 1
VIYGSVCSGIEAATMAWHPLGWRPSFFSEIEKFPRAVLQHHYPETPLHGDFTTISEGDYEPIDLLVGGTPCQSFSIAGLRGGLGDDRGNLALEFLRLADRLRPKWILWENVPGVLSSNGGRDFGAFLGGLGECGYGWAYRVLDAQYTRTRAFPAAVPQRRRRVFVVGYLGDWRRAAAVLFDAESLRRNPPPRREAGQGSAASTDAGADGSREGVVANSGSVSHCVTASGQQSLDAETETLIATVSGPVSHTLKGEGHDASEDGSGRGVPVVAFDMRGRDGGAMPEGPHDTANIRAASGGSSRSYVAYDTTQVTSKANRSNPKPGDPCHPITAGGDAPLLTSYVAQPYSIMPMNSGRDYKARKTDVAQRLMAGGPVGGNQGGDFIASPWEVRRLTPVECERLMGFPDGFTNIPWRGKPTAPDGPRYKALGNSMAVNVMQWLGERINMVESITEENQ